MPIDAYSYCPGGTGKKIKFCCPDLLGDLQQIDRMISGEQFQACLKHIENLEPKHPDKACLLSTKARLLRFVGKLDEARPVIARFLEKFPGNQVALAESAILAAATEGGSAGMKGLQLALAASLEVMYGRVYEAMEVVARVLMGENQIRAARAILQYQIMVNEDNSDAIERYGELNRSPNVPLLIRDDPMPMECPDDAPWKARFDEAMEPMRQGNFLETEQRLKALAEEAGDSPAIWWNLALFRGRLADTSGWVDALHGYATLDVPLEKAVEAEALALVLGEDPLGDNLDMLMLTYDIEDIDALQAAFVASPRAAEVGFDPSHFQEGQVPPKAAYSLLSCPMPERTEGLTLKEIPGLMGQAMLFGRQTDQAARLLVVGITSRNLEEAEALLRELAGDGLPSESRQEIVAQVSASREMLQRPWRLPQGITEEQLDKLADEHLRQAVLEEWPHLPLGIFSERTLEQAADDEASHTSVLAAILLLEFWSEQTGEEFDFNELRTQLGLPTLEPIDPDETPLDELSLMQLGRVMVDKLSDEDLLNGFRRTAMYGVAKALLVFGRALADRPSFDGKNEQLQALNLLARMEDDADRALAYVERGRQAVKAQGQSCAPWDLIELPIHADRMDGDQVARLIGHLQNEHIREPGVAQALTELLMKMGIINPDGSMAEPSGGEPSLAVPDASDTESGEIWTPDSQKPAGEKPGIWTPDMG